MHAGTCVSLSLILLDVSSILIKSASLSCKKNPNIRWQLGRNRDMAR